MAERQQNRKTTEQKDNKTERQQNKMTTEGKDYRTEGNRTKRQQDRETTEQNSNMGKRVHGMTQDYRNQVILHNCNVVIFYNKQAIRVLKRKRFHYGTKNGLI